MSDGVRCMWMRGGTSKGGYFVAGDLPADTVARDRFLLGMMGSPDKRQIDGMGGADPLTSKIAVVKKSERPGVDVDYLFLQAFVDKPIITDAQNCGNILVGVGPFAIERGLAKPAGEETQVVIYMENTGQIAVANVRTPGGGMPTYAGDRAIDGVPGTASPIPIEFRDTAGSSCGALLPTGNAFDIIDGVQCTLIDNGMPVVAMRAADLGIAGTETRDELDAHVELKKKLESIRLQAGPMMNLGDVKDASVPKMTLVSAPRAGGAISTRTFIPHRCHASIGVLGAVSVASACMIEGSPAASLANIPAGDPKVLDIEHPTGASTIRVKGSGPSATAAVVLTARKLFDGVAFAP